MPLSRIADKAVRHKKENMETVFWMYNTKWWNGSSGILRVAFNIFINTGSNAKIFSELSPIGQPL